jgi:hypothetical protein
MDRSIRPTEAFAVPSMARQKTFIVENGALLDFETKKSILSIVMMEVGDGVLLENETTRELSVNLDQIDNAEVILHVYNIVRNRRESLNRPAHDGHTRRR